LEQGGCFVESNIRQNTFPVSSTDKSAAKEQHFSPRNQRSRLPLFAALIEIALSSQTMIRVNKLCPSFTISDVVGVATVQLSPDTCAFAMADIPSSVLFLTDHPPGIANRKRQSPDNLGTWLKFHLHSIPSLPSRRNVWNLCSSNWRLVSSFRRSHRSLTRGHTRDSTAGAALLHTCIVSVT